eukprot:CAMPEP_0204619718 /NCGR_PEP_ID=MMETSP0717-20131115/5970_1 /ASSEMBLY_ACC=CAM_ASM_000666 /TAXON_ID=230516 /ORGANISM="Chaetoceros curvisetus" /LENGTH=270 /DNA_ID=CAMNT_0051633767 /DNA_START=217 /DNA_END=1029 /DNA_ORIENTATION=-
MVFGLGPGRTGTESLRLALIELGFGPTYHMREILFQEQGIPTYDDMQQWTEAAMGQEVDWYDLLGKDWGSGCDYPLSVFPEELHAAFPDAKFILTKRPGKGWYKSLTNTICGFSSEKYPNKFLQYLPFEPFRRFSKQTIMLDAVTKYKFAPGIADSWADLCSSEEIAIRALDEWNQKVESGGVVPLDKLFVFELGKHGYRELSEFLGVKEPSTPYPRVNSTNEIKFVIRMMWFAMFVIILGIVLSVGILIFIMKTIVNRRRGSSSSKKID